MSRCLTPKKSDEEKSLLISGGTGPLPPESSCTSARSGAAGSDPSAPAFKEDTPSERGMVQFAGWFRKWMMTGGTPGFGNRK